MVSKNWSTGDVVTATDFNTVLADQVLMVFADGTARDAGFGGAGEPTLGEGMFCFLSGTNEFQVYNGSAWVTIGDPDVLTVNSATGRVTVAFSGDPAVLIQDDDATNPDDATMTATLQMIAADGNTAGLVGFPNSGDLHFYVESRANEGNIVFRTETGGSGGTRMTLTAAGALELAGDLDLSDSGTIELGTGDDLKVYANGSNSFIDHSGDGDLWIRTLGAGEDLYLNAKDAMALQTDSVTRIYINAATDVGIATTSPHEKLDVHGNIAINPEITFVPLTNGNAIGYINFHGYQGGATQYRDLGVYDGRQGLVTLFDGSSGYVGFGPTVTVPSYPLHVINGANQTVEINNSVATASASTSLLNLWYSGDADATNGLFIKFADSLAAIGSVSVASTSSVSFNTTSDYRIKSNVADLTDAVASVKALRPVTFTFTRDADHRVHQGFLAHEVAEVCPRAVTGEKDGMRTIAAVEAVEAVAEVKAAEATYDDDGNQLTPAVYPVPAVEAVEAVPAHEVEDHQMMDASKLVPLLTAAVQELSARLTAGGL
jgi:hypothetical protein